jgi:hypothetical protein
MSISKLCGVICAGLALVALSGAAQAQTGNPLAGNWQYSWTGSGSSLQGQVSDGYGNVGGLFAGAELTNNGTAVAYNSYCNDLGEEIPWNGTNGTQAPLNTTVYQLSNLTAGEIAGTSNGAGGSPLVSYDQNNNAIAAGQTVDGISGQQKVNTLEYLVATNWNAALNDTTGLDAGALQLAIWHLWGYTTPYGSGTSDGAAAVQAQTWVNAAESYVAANQSYTNADVLWIYNSPTQNQIMFDPTLFNPNGQVTPEGQSFALLLPGLLPIAFVIRRKLRKA